MKNPSKPTSNDSPSTKDEDSIIIKPSLISRNIAAKVAEEELKKTENYESLKIIYLKLLNQLLVDGIPRERVSAVGQKIIVDKKRSIKRTDGASEDDVKKINIGSWWYDVVKEANFSFTPVTDKKIVPSKYEKENAQHIELINNTIEFLKDIALPKLKTKHFMSLLDSKKTKVVFHDWQAQLDIAKSLLDHKEKIPPNTQHILLHAISTLSSNNSVTTEYYKQRLEAHELTGKQLSKYRKGLIKKGPAILEVKDRIIAMLWNYVGIQCKCKSWRVKKIDDAGNGVKGECLDCMKIMNVKQPFKCPNCDILFYEQDLDPFKNDMKRIESEMQQDPNATPDKVSCPQCHEIFTPLMLNYIKSV